MNKQLFLKIRWGSIAIVTLAITSLLTWNHFNGGIPSHHILAREDMPEMSNAWGILLLPVLTFLVLFRIEQRINKMYPEDTGKLKSHINFLYRFLAALLFGVLVSTFFTLGYNDIPFFLFIGLLFSALFFPIYRAECLLGFVLGMTYTFGAVLPTGIGSILSMLGMIIYLLIHPVLLFMGVKAIKILKRSDN